jgi:hypothetical protein
MSAALRVKSHWFRDTAPRGARDIATAMAAIVWKTAGHRLKHMRTVDFDIETGEPYVGVLVEFLAFLVAVADRIAYAHDPGAWRSEFTSTLATRVGELLQDSFDDLLGSAGDGGYRRRFIDRVNERAADYASFGYTDRDGPEFGFLRHFGDVVREALPRDFDRAWGADQAMSIEGPAAAETIAQGMRGLLGKAQRARRAHEGGEA